MKQRITFQRTETVTLEFDYPVDPFTRPNAEYWINLRQAYGGAIPEGWPGKGDVFDKTATTWKVLKSEPPIMPSPNQTPAKKIARKRS